MTGSRKLQKLEKKELRIVKGRSLTDEVFFTTTLLASRLKVIAGIDDLYNMIVPHLYLGMIPSSKEAKTIKEALPNLKVIVSIVEENEISGNGVFFKNDIQSPLEWYQLDPKINQIIIPVRDCTAEIPINKFIEALKVVRAAILEGKDVYVHCKAGVGRSATFIAGYLAAFGSPDGVLKPYAKPEEIRDYILSQRANVNLKEMNLNKIEELINTLILTKRVGLDAPIEKNAALDESQENNITAAKETNPSLAERFNAYVISKQGKEEIQNLAAFLELRVYAPGSQHLVTKYSHRSEYINDFFSLITQSDDAKWCIDILKGRNAELQGLLNARPYYGLFGTGKPQTRQTTVDLLVKELREHLMAKLNCHSSEEFDSLIDNFDIRSHKLIEGKYQFIDEYLPDDQGLALLNLSSSRSP